MSENKEDIDLFIEYGKWDWYVTKSHNLLHYAGLTDEQKSYIPENWCVPVPVKLACGRTAAEIHIPGMFTRVSAQRCSGCCRALGYPQGIGSPKNDPAVRRLLGLPVKPLQGLLAHTVFTHGVEGERKKSDF